MAIQIQTAICYFIIFPSRRLHQGSGNKGRNGNIPGKDAVVLKGKRILSLYSPKICGQPCNCLFHGRIISPIINSCFGIVAGNPYHVFGCLKIISFSFYKTLIPCNRNICFREILLLRCHRGNNFTGIKLGRVLTVLCADPLFNDQRAFHTCFIGQPAGEFHLPVLSTVLAFKQGNEYRILYAVIISAQFQIFKRCCSGNQKALSGIQFRSSVYSQIVHSDLTA